MKSLCAKLPFFAVAPILALLLVASLCLFDGNTGLSDAMTAFSEYCDEAVINREIPDTPTLEWQHVLLIGILIGAVLAAVLTKAFKLEFTFGGANHFSDFLKTAGSGIAGGFLMMLGIQLAGDTVWGQWAAAIQLSSGAWLFLAAMTITGVVLAILFEQRGGGKISGNSGSKNEKAVPAADKKAKSATARRTK